MAKSRLTDRTPRPGTPERDVQLCVEIFRNLHLGLAVWCLEDTNDARTFRLIAVNPAVEQTAMAKPEEYVGANMAEAFPAMFETPMPENYAEVVRSGVARDLGLIHYGDHIIPEGNYLVKLFPLPGNCVGAMYERVRYKPRPHGKSGSMSTASRTRRGRRTEGKADFGLTRREHAVLYYVAAGRANKEIAVRLGISPLTVQKHVSHILHKMHASSRTEASVVAHKSGLLY